MGRNGITGLQKTALMHASAHLCQVDRESIDDERAPAVLEPCARRSSRALRIPVRVTEVVPLKISMRVRGAKVKTVRANGSKSEEKGSRKSRGKPRKADKGVMQRAGRGGFTEALDGSGEDLYD